MKDKNEKNGEVQADGVDDGRRNLLTGAAAAVTVAAGAAGLAGMANAATPKAEKK